MFFSIDMPTRLPNLCVSCHTTIEQPSHTIEQLWHNSVTTATLLNSPPSDPHLWWQACPWRKSLSRKIALTRIKFYGKNLPWIHSKISAVPVFALFFLFGLWPQCKHDGIPPPLRRAFGRSACACASSVPTVTDYRANCHRSSGRIGHLFNLHFGSRWLTEPFR